MKTGPPPAELDFDPAADLLDYTGALFRVFRAKGEHPCEWNELRYVGPVPGMRFDPYLPPDLVARERGVMYTSSSLRTAFAEVFQKDRVISGAGGATLAGWLPSRPLRLVDLSSTFLVRNGSAAALMMGPKRHTQEWAESIDQTLGDQVDGLWHLSSLTSEPIVTLFERSTAVTSFPALPGVHRSVDDPVMRKTILRAAVTLNYGIR